jgi:hypothetical protein
MLFLIIKTNAMLSNNYCKTTYSKSNVSNQTSKVIILFLVFFSIINFYGQKNNSTIEKFLSSNKALHSYQLEKFFLHTNKTNYYPGEKIWFKAYIVNDTDDKLSRQTTNLQLNLFNSNKELVLSQLHLVENGITNGDIDLPKNFITGKYYIELTTQWNQNFKNNSAVFPIKIIDNTQKNNPISNELEVLNATNSNIQESININFFSDSSILLEDAINSITFTSKSNSNPIKIIGDIIDNTTGIIVSKIESNIFGMGRFELFCRPNRTYSAIINYNGIEKTTPIQIAQSKGILIEKNVSQKIDSIISFTLKSNKNTVSANSNNTIFAVLHRNGYVNSIIPIKLKKKYLNYSISFLKGNLFKGVNSVSLFNKRNEVIAEYSFFHNDYKKIDLDIVKTSDEIDSLTLNFKLMNGLKDANLSVSVLPEQTRVYMDQSSIVTSFLLAPYLESTRLDLPNFFNSKNSEENIDYLIKTGIKANVFPFNNKSNTHSENGMSIKGNVSSNVKDLSNYKIMLSSEENNILLIDSIGKSNSFTFNNLILKHPSKYKLALLNSKGEIIKTGFRIKNELINYKPKKTLSRTIEITEHVENSSSNTDEIEIDYTYTPTSFDDVNLLDVVTLTKKQKRENELKKLGIKAEILNNGFSNLFIIKEDQAITTVYDYLYRIPGIKVFGESPNKEFTIRTTRGQGSLLGSNNMAVFIDGVLSDSEFLTSRNINDFVAINVNSSGAGQGITGMGGVINFYTKKGKFSEYRTSTNKDIFISETDLGFKFPSEYSNNQFTFENQLSKEYFGTIGWFPNFNIKPNSENLLKFSKNGVQDIKVIVNGMDSDGNLIFKIADFN